LDLTEAEKEVSVAVFVLVHGGSHRGWCWEHVLPLLEAQGHTALAPDLPGLADNEESVEHVSLAATADFVADIVRAQPEPVILAGHSLGGITISEVAERVPGRIASLVYVTAMLVPSGQSLMECDGRSTHAGVTRSTDGRSIIFDPEAAPSKLYNRTSDDRARAAARRLQVQPMGTALTRLQLTDERYGSVPRAYIECSDDNAIALDMQRRMQSALPCDPVITLPSDHSPFLSMPEELAKALISIGARHASLSRFGLAAAR
jgi:pimeloyl-ACP methyl ester carboxylesterase